MASMRPSPSATGSSFPAVSKLARYLSGMRRLRTSGISPSKPILPDSTAEWIGESGGTRLLDHLRIVRVEEDAELRLIEVLLVGNARGLLDAVGVVEHHAEVAD